jgi:hypothetical protein
MPSPHTVKSPRAPVSVISVGNTADTPERSYVMPLKKILPPPPKPKKPKKPLPHPQPTKPYRG